MIITDANASGRPLGNSQAGITILGIVLFVGGLALLGWGFSLGMDSFRVSGGEFQGFAMLALGASAVLMGIGAGMASRVRVVGFLLAALAIGWSIVLFTSPRAFGGIFTSGSPLQPLAEASFYAAFYGGLIPFGVALIGPIHRVRGRGLIALIGVVLACLAAIAAWIAGADLFEQVTRFLSRDTAGLMLLTIALGVVVGVLLWGAVFGQGWYVLGGILLLIFMVAIIDSPDVLIGPGMDLGGHSLVSAAISVQLGTMVFFVAAFFAAAARVLPPRAPGSFDSPLTVTAIPSQTGYAPVAQTNVSPGLIPKAPRGFAQPGANSPL